MNKERDKFAGRRQSFGMSTTADLDNQVYTVTSATKGGILRKGDKFTLPVSTFTKEAFEGPRTMEVKLLIEALLTRYEQTLAGKPVRDADELMAYARAYLEKLP